MSLPTRRYYLNSIRLLFGATVFLQTSTVFKIAVIRRHFTWLTIVTSASKEIYLHGINMTLSIASPLP